MQNYRNSRGRFLKVTDNTTCATRRDRRRTARKNIVGANAFTAGRTTAAVLAASGLVITTGVAANAAENSDEGRESATVQLNTAELTVERASQNEAVAVTASSDVELSFDRPVVSSEASPERVAAEEAAEQAAADEEAQREADAEAAAEAQREAEADAQAQQDAAAEQAEADAQAQQDAAAEQAEADAQAQQDVAAEQAETDAQAQQATSTQEQSEPEPEPASQNQGATTVSESTPEPEPEPESTPESSGGHSSVVGAAYGYIGIPWSQMDCSALVQNAYAQSGVSVPRDTYGQMTLPQVSSPAPGDIVIANGGGHAAIYIGNGQVISSTASQGIRVHGLHEGWHNVDSYHRPG